jgi:alkylhydroperoxidase family enzyme
VGGAGFTEEEIFEAAQIVSIYNSNNRLNNVLGLRPNEEARVSYRAG